MKETINFLKGKKTFIVSGVIIVIAGLNKLGYIDEATYQFIITLLAGAGLTTLRMGQMKK